MIDQKSSTNVTPPKVRVQLDLHPEMMVLIDRLVEQTCSASRAEVLRRAISLYAILLDEKQAGKRIEVIDPKHKKIRERLILP